MLLLALSSKRIKWIWGVKTDDWKVDNLFSKPVFQACSMPDNANRVNEGTGVFGFSLSIVLVESYVK